MTTETRRVINDGFEQYTLPGPYRTIAAVKRANAAHGGHWFDTSAMEFFASRIESEMVDGRLFVTSEQHGESSRRYTVRVASDTGAIHTIGDFQGYDTLASAVEAAKTLAAGGSR